MALSGFPTGTVSGGRSERTPTERDLEARVAELERENEALRAAVERQRRENERIVARYEALLEKERERDCEAGDAPETSQDDVRSRLASLLD